LLQKILLKTFNLFQESRCRVKVPPAMSFHQSPYLSLVLIDQIFFL